MASLRHSLATLFQPRPGEAPAPAEGRSRRASLGLQELISILTGVGHPAVLDLGCVWQATVSFFTQAGCKLYTEDVFPRLYQALAPAPAEAPPLAERFLPEVLQYDQGTFHGILAWDLFDYLPEELAPPVAVRLHALLQPGGGLLLLFHNRPEESPFHRYRVVDAETLELLFGSLPLRLQRTYNNRALLNLFSAFRSSRTFVGRDNLRELFLLK